MSDRQPTIRKIYRTPGEEKHLDDDSTDGTPSSSSVLPCAYHITDAFALEDLEKLNALREKIPLDISRPTCPRRFLTEKNKQQQQQQQDDHNNDKSTQQVERQQHQEDGWVGALIDKTVASWDLPQQFCSLPWYRYLEYTEPGGHMDKHTDGSNVHPTTGARSAATMLLYLSTCRTGGATTLYHAKEKKKKKQQQQQQPEVRRGGSIVESIRPVYNTVLIFPHAWPHSGDPVTEDPKIALRIDLSWKKE